MDKHELQRIERENNRGQASPADVQALIARVRLLESVIEDRLNDDFDRASKAVPVKPCSQ